MEEKEREAYQLLTEFKENSNSGVQYIKEEVGTSAEPQKKKSRAIHGEDLASKE
jgi:hypothetical protein